MIYMDNAATTLHKPDAVKEAVLAAFDTMGNAGRGAHKIYTYHDGKSVALRRAAAGIF